jgi:hypothetical protein
MPIKFSLLKTGLGEVKESFVGQASSSRENHRPIFCVANIANLSAKAPI